MHLSAFFLNNINIITVMYLVKDIHILSKEHNSFPVVMVQKCKNCRCKVSIGRVSPEMVFKSCPITQC